MMHMSVPVPVLVPVIYIYIWFKNKKSYLSGHMSSNHVDFILQYIIVELFSEPEPEPEPIHASYIRGNMLYLIYIVLVIILCV